MPETRFEVIDGKVVYVPPSDIPHGSRHSKASALLEAYAAAGYEVVSDVLTRTSVTGDMAPDVSVLPAGKDPMTGGRRIEELAFEVVSTERLNAAGKMAAELSKRGVRRVFAIDVKRQRLLEWFPDTATWRLISRDARIEDRALALPLPVVALVGASKADDAVATALLAKCNPVLEAALEDREAKGEARGEAKGEARGEAKGEARGQWQGLARALLATLAARSLRVSKAQRQRVLRCTDAALLERWIRRAAMAERATDVFER